MKFVINLKYFLLFILISFTFTINLKENSHIRSSNYLQSFSEYLLSELKFEPNSNIDDLVLKERIHSTQIYETWYLLIFIKVCNKRRRNQFQALLCPHI